MTTAITADRLSKGYEDWTSQSIAYDTQKGNHVFSVFAQYHDRGEVEGKELLFSHYLARPAGEIDLSYQLQAGEGEAWARHGARAALHWRAGKGWVLSGGGAYRHFAQSDSRSLFVELEHYIGNERFAYKLEQDLSSGADANLRMHQASWSHYFDSGAQATLTLAGGREINRDFGRILPSSEVLTAAVHGIVPINASLDLVPAVSWTRQDKAYERLTASVGIRYRF